MSNVIKKSLPILLFLSSLLVSSYLSLTYLYGHNVIDFTQDILELRITKDYYPARFNCGSWNKTEGWIHILSDILSFWCYILIASVILFNYLVHDIRTADLKYFCFSFVAVFTTCGTTHLLDALMFFEPYYSILGIFKVINAILSTIGLIIFVNLLPRLIIQTNKMIYIFKNGLQQSKYSTNEE